MYSSNYFQTVLIVATLFAITFRGCESIACFKCQSKGGNDLACEQGLASIGYEETCHFRLNGRQNSFPGVYCVKISGNLLPSKERIVIRDCDEKPLKHLTPGNFVFHGIKINGTAYSCKTNYCNNAESILNNHHYWSLTSFLLFLAYYLILCHKI